MADGLPTVVAPCAFSHIYPSVKRAVWLLWRMEADPSGMDTKLPFFFFNLTEINTYDIFS